MSTKLLIQVACLLLPICLQAQSSWDGGAGTTNWQDAANWNPNGVPPAGAVVTIGVDLTITGFATNNPAQIRITNASQVTLDLVLLNIGDGTINEHGLVVGADCILNIASGRSITINVPTGRQGVNISGVASNAAFNIQSNASLFIQQSLHGINVDNNSTSISNAGAIFVIMPAGDGIRMTGGSFTNNGSITILEAGSDGIENNGDFDNSGDIEIEEAGSDGIENNSDFDNSGDIKIEDADRHGIFNGTGSAFTNSSDLTILNPGVLTNDGINSSGTLTNSSSGTITITNMDDDGIDLQDGTFTNDGTVNVTVKNAASSGNNGISVGTSTVMATFNNSSTGTVNADGGTGSIGRGINVQEMGILDNSGTMLFTNGNAGARLFSLGEVTNDLGGIMDMNDGRIRIDQGTFTNNGLIESTRGTPGVLNSATAINNAFFSYAGSNAFASGSGTTTDNGIDLNDPSETTIDAGGGCTVDIAEVSYEYFDGANSVGTTDASGGITFLNVLSSDPVVLTNELPGVSLTIENVCSAALPIELTYFRATPGKDDVDIEWQTASEINNDYMAVERSSDGRRFTEIGRQAGAGNSEHTITYRITDREPLSGRSYYRLRQVDFDGTQSFSEVVSVYFSGIGEQLSVYPTLLEAYTSLTVDLTSVQDNEVTLELIDMSGRVVRQYRLGGGSRHEINVSGLDAGMYQFKGIGKHQGLTSRIIVL